MTVPVFIKVYKKRISDQINCIILKSDERQTNG